MGDDFQALRLAVRRPVERWWRRTGASYLLLTLVLLAIQTGYLGWFHLVWRELQAGHGINQQLLEPSFWFDTWRELHWLTPALITLVWLLAAIRASAAVDDLTQDTTLPDAARRLAWLKFTLGLRQGIWPCLLSAVHWYLFGVWQTDRWLYDLWHSQWYQMQAALPFELGLHRLWAPIASLGGVAQECALLLPLLALLAARHAPQRLAVLLWATLYLLPNLRNVLATNYLIAHVYPLPPLPSHIAGTLTLALLQAGAALSLLWLVWLWHRGSRGLGQALGWLLILLALIKAVNLATGHAAIDQGLEYLSRLAPSTALFDAAYIYAWADKYQLAVFRLVGWNTQLPLAPYFTPLLLFIPALNPVLYYYALRAVLWWPFQRAAPDVR